MNWKFWEKAPQKESNPWRTIAFSSTSATTTKPPTVAEQIEALTKRVADLEKDTTVFSNDGLVYYFTSGSGSTAWAEQKTRPRVGEGVRLLMAHLGLTFQHGTKSTDRLVEAKKPKKK